MADLFCRRNISQSFSIANFKKFFKRLIQLENFGLAHLIGEARGFCFPPCMADLFCRRNISQSFSIANFKKFFKRLIQLENFGLAHLI